MGDLGVHAFPNSISPKVKLEFKLIYYITIQYISLYTMGTLYIFHFVLMPFKKGTNLSLLQLAIDKWLGRLVSLALVGKLV